MGAIPTPRRSRESIDDATLRPPEARLYSPVLRLRSGRSAGAVRISFELRSEEHAQVRSGVAFASGRLMRPFTGVRMLVERAAHHQLDGFRR